MMIPIVALVNGEACIVQAENSQVQLHIPKGVHGVILANTNHARFTHQIPDGHCLISQLYDYHLQQPYQEQSLSKKHKIHIPPSLSEDIKYQIQMPYVIKDAEKVCSNISVQHENPHSYVSKLENPSTKAQEGNISFDIHEKLITLHTKHLSRYIVTTKSIDCCGQRVNVHLFAALRNIPEAAPHVTVKVYLSSIHCDLKNFISVRTSFESKN